LSAIRHDLHRPVSIRPQDSDARILQPFQKLRAGVPVRVVFTSGYDPDTWLHSREEFRRRRILASVMADLQNVGTHCLRAILRKNFAFHLFFSVARQQ